MIDIDYVQIIKWILIVLLAGFIGQFGKSLATYLIKRARGEKATDRAEATAESHVPDQPKQAAERTPAPAPSISSERPTPPGKADKKAAKALIKMKKKENK